MFPPVQDCWFLTGATASGKTAVATELAQRLGAEIISMDSMALFRGMDIGTAKPTAAQRQAVRHHMIGVIEPHEEYSVAQYVAAAHKKVEAIRSRGSNVLFVGGTPLYLKALLRGFFEGPPADWQFRQDIEAELQSAGPLALHERLRQVDPLSATRLHPHDTRRTIRALEVHKVTGQPISHFQLQFEENQSAEQCRVYVLDRARAELLDRIQQRVEWMFRMGLEEEVCGLIRKGQRFGRTARQAVGYREVIRVLEGRLDRQEAIRQVNISTRRFAKHQTTWFRSLIECQFIPVEGETPPAMIAEQILEAQV